ncbi:MAG: hypothetical protein OSB69_02890, partial [Alphaproteobacteria bacterium]|nr:hypothetical protein [Alphaproteobacteria bacterium]
GESKNTIYGKPKPDSSTKEVLEIKLALRGDGSLMLVCLMVVSSLLPFCICHCRYLCFIRDRVSSIDEVSADQ